MNFSCKGCVFFSYHQKNISCKIDDRFVKLSNNSYTLDDDFHPKFNRFCNTYRPDSWLTEYANGDLEQAVSLVKQEVYPRLTFIIEFNKDINFLKSLLETINSQNTRKFVVVINPNVEYNLDVFSLMQFTLTNNVGGFNLVQTVDNNKSFDEAFTKAKNGWTIFLKEGVNIPLNIAETLNDRINSQLRRIVYAESQDASKVIVQSAIYKMLGGNQPLMRGDGTVDNRSFKDKLTEMISEDKDSITTWEELFNE